MYHITKLPLFECREQYPISLGGQVEMSSDVVGHKLRKKLPKLRNCDVAGRDGRYDTVRGGSGDASPLAIDYLLLLC